MPADRSPAPPLQVTAGHVALGRMVLVGSPSPTPNGWDPRDRVVLSGDPAAALERVRHLLARRQPAVIVLDDWLERTVSSPTSTDIEPHAAGVSFAFHTDDLGTLLRGAAVDLCGPQPRWVPLEAALALGATVATDGRGDIVLPDGSRAWIDGGPTRFTPPLDGIPVLHRTCIEHGSLTPFAANDASGIDLADDQRAAVTHDTGTARIIAPAGSGKTRVLTERARHLITRWHVPASAITLVAFNKRAEEEMRARTTDLRGIQIRTLNAIALAIVNGRPPFAPQPDSLTTLDEPEVRRVIGRLVKFARRRNTDPVATWLEALSVARLGLLSPDAVEARYDGEVDGFAEFLPRFRAELRRQRAVDYDEQIHRALHLLLSDSSARAVAQRSCRLLLVDEFQDLTPAHLLLVRLLAGADASVFGVGDDDQTIYGYNGADPGWLIDFSRYFPGAGDHPLHTNYRCAGGIVRAADTLLRNNDRRVDKRIVAARADSDGFTIADHPTQVDDTVAATVTAITGAIGRGVAPSDIAVLTRVNSLLAPVQAALAAGGVPVNGGVGAEFLDRASVAASMAWLRLATGGERLSPADVAAAVRRPARSLHPRIADWVAEQSSIEGLRRLAGRINTERDAATVDEFTDDIEALQQLTIDGGTTTELLVALHRRTRLDATIAGLDGTRHGMNRASQFDDVTALFQLAELHHDPADFETWMRRVFSSRGDGAGVTLATVHRVKGLEWPYVVVHHAAADQFPHRLAEDVEEERRLFHVAITRAGRKVFVVPGADPSPFIAECRGERPARPAARAAAPVVSSSRGAGAPAPAPMGPGDEALFEALRAWRRAAAAGKPAFTVLADAALRAIAAARPRSLPDLARVKGIGPAKLTQYGDQILDVVRNAG
ncbi:MAG: ATP-dependent helicase [Ilumatobacteraceae bacterium]